MDCSLRSLYLIRSRVSWDVMWRQGTTIPESSKEFQWRRLMPTVHCSCCGRSKVDVSHMIAGPNVYLCERCVAQAARQLAPGRLAPGRLAPGRPAPDAVRCRFCHQRRATGEVTT